MTFYRLVRYLSGPVATGLLAAAAVLLVLPHITGTPVTGDGNGAEDSRQTAVEPGNHPPGPDSYADAVSRAAPSVVNIYTRTVQERPRHPLMDDPFFRRFFEREGRPQQQRMQSSLGSGVIVDEDGYILTNNHVVANADEIVILLYDGREAQAEVIGSDNEMDLAVLKVDMPDLTPIDLGNLSQARVGDVVLAIGNPFGVGQSVSQGIISATGRGLGLNTFENFLQTDAAINPGNSGGALIDTAGNLLGINAAILNETTSVGIGFAIPADTAIKVMHDLVEHGRVIRGWLGVQAQQLEPFVAERMGIDPPRGLIITDIHINGPAHQAGLQPGDIITHINGQLVGNGRRGTNMVADLKPGDPIRIDVLRNGEKVSVSAIAGIRPTMER